VGAAGCRGAAGLGSWRDERIWKKKEEGREGRRQGDAALGNPLTAQDATWTHPKGPSGRLEKRFLGGPSSPSLEAGRPPELGVS
jgi:hypothetical protein